MFSAQLQSLRKEKGVTQEMLASHLGVSPQAVSKWENGSYPDGDLLPKIADFFGVSIDYLYGRARREVSVEQQIFEELQALPESDSEHAENFDRMLDFLWAFQTSAWRTNKCYYQRPIVDDDNCVTASQLTDSSGFTFMRLNKSLQYYMLVRKPEEGFESILKPSDRMAELFAFLGDKSNLKILFYMLSLKSGEAVAAQTIARRLSLPLEKVEKALRYLNGADGSGPKNIFYRANLIGDGMGDSHIYSRDLTKSVHAVMLLICADSMLRTPDGYQMQVGRNIDSLFDRGKLDFLTDNMQED